MRESEAGDPLFHAIESAYPTIQKTIRRSYEKSETVNAIWLIMRSRGVRNPTRLQICMAAIDFHRMQTHYRRGQRHGEMLTNFRMREAGPQVFGESVAPEPVAREPQDTQIQIVEHMRDVRRRFGTDGLAIFLLTRIMDLDPKHIQHIMDFDPNSSLAKSLSVYGQEV